MPLVIFDLDDTLVDRAGLARRWATEWAADHALRADEVAWLVDADCGGYTPREAFFTAVRERLGLDEPVPTLIEACRERMVALVEPDPGALRALVLLRRAGWRIAIVTNGDTALQRAKIRRSGLDAVVDAIAVSGELGVGKPDPRIFEVAARRCGERLDGTGWMVGDSPQWDVVGGRGVGLRTIWLRHGRSWDDGLPAPDAAVDSLDEAVRILTGGESAGAPPSDRSGRMPP